MSLRICLAALVVALAAGCGGPGPEALVASARDKLAKGDPRAAVIEAKNALQKQPDFAPARVVLGTALLESGDAAGAEVELLRAQESRISSDDYLPPLLRTYLAQGKFAKVVEAGANAPLVAKEAIADVMTSVAAAELAQRRAKEGAEALAAALRAQPEFLPALLLKARLAASERDVPGALTIVENVLAKRAKDPDALKFRADLLTAQGKTDEALEGYRKVLTVQPGMVAAHAALVEGLRRERKTDDAARAFEAMKKAAPKHPQTLYLEAQLALQRRDFKAAREASQALLRIAPNNPAALVQGGIVEYGLRSFAQAEAALAKALQLAPDAAVARRWLAMTHLAQGQTAKAVAVLEPALARPEVDANLLMVAGQAFMQAGDAKRAEDYLARAVKAQPDDPRKRTALAMARLGRGETDAALADLGQISAADQGATADLALIAAHLRRGEIDRALAAIDVLAKKQPDKALPHDLRGRALLAKKDAAGARASFERALGVEPAYFQAAASLAALDLAERRSGDAVARFEKMVAADPRNVRALLAIAEIKAREKASAEEVVALLGRAVAAGPTDVSARVALVSHHLQARDPKKAVTAAQDALAAIPDRAEVLDLLGRAQLAAGDHFQAVATFGKMATLQPTSAEPHLRLAEAHMAAKNSGAAAQSLRKALDLRPDLVGAQRGLAAIAMADGKPQDALAIARRLQQDKTANVAGYLLEGDLQAARRAWAEAADAYRRGLAKAKSSELAMKLHSVLLAGGRAQEGAGFAATWLKGNPRDTGFRMHLGDTASARKDHAGAVAQYRAILETRPEDPIVLNNLAWSLGKLKDPAAVGIAEKALSLAPAQPAIMDTLAVLLSERGEATRALDLFSRALKAAPEAHAIRLNYARVLAQAGQRAEARRELDALAKLGERFGAQAEVEQMLKSL